MEDKRNLRDISIERRAIKAFSDQEIDDKTLNYIFDTTRNAPASCGYESTRYLVFAKGPKREEIKDMFQMNEPKFSECSHVVMFVTKDASAINSNELKDALVELAKRKFDKVEMQMIDGIVGYVQNHLNGVEADYVTDTDQAKTDWAAKQAYTQLGYMMLAAQEQGVDSLPVEGFDYSALRKKLTSMGLIEKNEFVSVSLFLGYRDKARMNTFGKQTRRSLKEMAKIVK